MQNIVGEATGESLNHLCYFFLTRNLLEIIYIFFSKIDTIKKFLSHLYTVVRLAQLFVSYPVMGKVVFWSWETHVALCIHWVCDGEKKKTRFNFSNNRFNFSYICCITLPALLCLNSWKTFPQPTLANLAWETDTQITHSHSGLLCNPDPPCTQPSASGQREHKLDNLKHNQQLTWRKVKFPERPTQWKSSV